MGTTAPTIGQNIREARDARGLSLRQLEDAIAEAGRIDGLGYTAIQRIESGSRKVASHELAELAEILGTTTARLLGQKDRSASLALAARVTDDLGNDTLADVRQRAVEILEAEDVLGRLVGPPPVVSVPRLPQVPASRPGGRKLAAAAREALGLGTAPIADLAAVVESRFGAHVVHEPLRDGTHGFCVIGDGAAVIIVNSMDTWGRQRFTLAHELCHLITRDLDVWEVVEEAGSTQQGSEGRADDFAAHFLAPDAGVRAAAGGQPVDAPGAMRIAHQFGISLEAALIRLRDLRLASDEVIAAARSNNNRYLSQLAGLTGEYEEAQSKVGRATPPIRLTERAYVAYEAGDVGLGLVASVLGETHFAQVRDQLVAADTW